MQNRYVGDLGDFGKYGLLRALCSPNRVDAGPALSLGIAWYLIPNESHNDDGRHIRYLDAKCSEPSSRNRQQFRECDPPLYDALRAIIQANDRNVVSIRESGVLPADTVYYEEKLNFDGINGVGSRERRAARRKQWVEQTLARMAGCDIVFVDPDNGLEVKARPYHKRGPKHVFFHELSQYTQRDQSVVIYHHIGRNGSAQEQIRERLTQIGERLGRAAIALRYRRGTARAFFIVPAQRHKEILGSRVARFQESSWKRHFKLIEPADGER